MRKILVFVGICLLSAGISYAQESPVSPATLLEEAVQRARLCGYTLEEATKFDKFGKPTAWKTAPKDEQKKVQDLTIEVIFRLDRFNIGEQVARSELAGRPMSVVSFSPKEKEGRLPPQGNEDKNYIRAINSFSGEVFIDEATGEIAKITAKLTEMMAVDYKFFRKAIHIESMEVTMNQFFHGGNWWLQNLELTATGSFYGIGNVRKQREAKFDCSAELVAAK